MGALRGLARPDARGRFTTSLMALGACAIGADLARVAAAAGVGGNAALGVQITCLALAGALVLRLLTTAAVAWSEVALGGVMVTGCLELIAYHVLQGLAPVTLSAQHATDVAGTLSAAWVTYAVRQVLPRQLAPAHLGIGIVRTGAWTACLATSGLNLSWPWLPLAVGLLSSHAAGLVLMARLSGGTSTLVVTPAPSSTLAPSVLGCVASTTTVVGPLVSPRIGGPVSAALALACVLSLIGRHLVTVSAVQRANAQLVEREEYYRRLLADSNDTILICSREGRLEYVSPNATHVLGEGVAVQGGAVSSALAITIEAFRSAVARLEREGGSVILEGRTGRVVLEAALSIRSGRVLASVRDVTERDRLRQRLHFLAYHDPLTGLVNRSRVLSRISAMLGGGEACAVLFIDLDRFKQVNDNSGHNVGDQVLQQVAGRLGSLIRGGDLVGRLGGDEFVAVVGASRGGAEQVAGRVCEQLTVPFEVDGRSYQLGASVGIALAIPGMLPDELLRRADLAMYEAKRRRAPFVVYESSLAQAALAQANTDVAVSRALRDRTLELFLQPLVDLRSGRVVTTEALLRWRDHTGEIRSPMEMLDYARRSGRMGEITSWVLERAIDLLSTSSPRVSLAVNMPPETLLAPGLPEHLQMLLAARRVSPGRLELEVTEDQLLEQGASVAVVETLRAIGMPVMIDDFGTGFSSLGYLVDLPIDGLKIDQRFTMALPHSEAARSIVGGLVGIAHTLGLRVVAEGIETREQHDWARELGVHLGQGFWYARPEDCTTLANLGDLSSWRTSQAVAEAFA